LEKPEHRGIEPGAADSNTASDNPIDSVAMRVDNGAPNKPFERYLNNATSPEIRDAFVNQAQDVRSTLLHQFDGKGNLALANLDVEGLPSQMRAFSQFQKGENGFVVLPEGETIFQPMSVNKYGVVDGKDSFSRIYDGEFKILETTARTLGNNPSATGRIDLFTELKACTSCGGAVQQFRTMYPNIQLNVFTKK
jgi:filamentous hemagglutinin